MKPLFVAFIVMFAIFVTWFVTRMIYLERFTTNFNPDDQGMEQSIRGYAYAFGNKRTDLDTYFGFPDDIQSGFNQRLLPDIIPYDDPVNKS